MLIDIPIVHACDYELIRRCVNVSTDKNTIESFGILELLRVLVHETDHRDKISVCSAVLDILVVITMLIHDSQQQLSSVIEVPVEIFRKPFRCIDKSNISLGI